MKKPVVSIVMPVYNAVDTLGRMVDSVRSQSYDDWELIVVDDGSTDGSGDVADRYAGIDSRVKVLHKRNAGVASSRQAGLEMAEGEFVIHADADDWIEPSMLADMVGLARLRGADIVISDFYVDSGSRSYRSVQKQESYSARSLIYAMHTGRLFGSLWHKLVRRRLIIDAGVSFEKGIDYCEDSLFMTRLLALTDPEVVYLPGAYYHYVQTEGSITRAVTPKGFESLRSFHRLVLDVLCDDKESENIRSGFMLDEFLVFFKNNLYSSVQDLRKAYMNIYDKANESWTLRWRLGGFCIRMGCIWLAGRLIKL